MPHQTFAQALASRRNNLDFLRFFFAALVILSHSFPMIDGDNLREPLFRLTGGRLTLGTLAVAGFFAISGFLITQSWQNSRRPSDFFRKRALRIYPGWTVALLICFFVVAPLSRGGIHLLIRDPVNVTFFSQLWLRQCGSGIVLNNVFAHNPVRGLPDGATWTIPFELMCYGLAAALGLLRVRALFPIFFITDLAYLLVPYYSYWTNTGPAPILSSTYFGRVDVLPLFVGYFLSGACLYQFRDQVPLSRVGAWICAAIVLGVMIYTGHSHSTRLLPLTLMTAGTYVLFSVGFAPTLRMQDFGHRRDLSYGVYCMAGLYRDCLYSMLATG